MSNEETIFYFSDAYKSELYKILIFTGIAGFIGGIFDSLLQKCFANKTSDSERSLARILLQYIGNSLFCVLATVVLVYIYFDSSIQSIKTIRTIYLYSIPLAITCPSLFTIALKFFSDSIYPQNKD